MSDCLALNSIKNGKTDFHHFEYESERKTRKKEGDETKTSEWNTLILKPPFAIEGYNTVRLSLLKIN